MKKKRKASRLFYVQLNTDDMSVHMDRLMTTQHRSDFLEGLYKGGRGVPMEPEEISALSQPFQRGYEFGKAAHDDALEVWNRSKEAGRKSAEARTAKNGTAQPKGGKGTNKRADGYTHPKWQELRLRAMERDQFSCKKCGAKDKQLHVHHLKYTVGAEVWESPLEDLETRCCTCHEASHK